MRKKKRRGESEEGKSKEIKEKGEGGGEEIDKSKKGK